MCRPFSGIRKNRGCAEERLQNAAELDLDLSGLDQNQVGIVVSNIGAGHSLPTGLADMRQMWLEIIIQDRDGNRAYETGILDEKNELPDNILIYRTVFGDGKGKSGA